MVTRRTKTATRKVKDLAAKRVSLKRAKVIKGGGEIPFIKDTDKGSSK